MKRFIASLLCVFLVGITHAAGTYDPSGGKTKQNVGMLYGDDVGTVQHMTEYKYSIVADANHMSLVMIRLNSDAGDYKGSTIGINTRFFHVAEVNCNTDKKKWYEPGHWFLWTNKDTLINHFSYNKSIASHKKLTHLHRLSNKK